MLTRRSLFGVAALPLFPKLDDITITKSPYLVTRSMEIQTINGYRFPFFWELEPGDKVLFCKVDEIEGLFVARDRVIGGRYIEASFAWNFHKKPSTSMRAKSIPWSSDLYKYYSLERGHKL